MVAVVWNRGRDEDPLRVEDCRSGRSPAIGVFALTSLSSEQMFVESVPSSQAAGDWWVRKCAMRLATGGTSTVRFVPTPTVVAAPVEFTATLPPLTRHIGPREATAPGIVTVSIVKQLLASSWMKRLHSGTVAPAAIPRT